MNLSERGMALTTSIRIRGILRKANGIMKMESGRMEQLLHLGKTIPWRLLYQNLIPSFFLQTAYVFYPLIAGNRQQSPILLPEANVSCNDFDWGLFFVTYM